jgi:formylglycine-generating enzyme required for sulfatase activity
VSSACWRALGLCGLIALSATLLSHAPASDVSVEDSDVDLTLSEKKTMTNSIGMKVVLVKAGRFTMGTLKGEPNRRDDEGPPHEVEITKDFWLGAFEVTQKQFRTIMGYNPSHFSTDGKARDKREYANPPAGGKDKVKGQDVDQFPVENVSWTEAQEFLKKLTAKAEEKKLGLTYRLPTEAEWEYAARGGPSSSRKLFDVGTPSDSLSSTLANFNGNFPVGGAAKGPFLNRTSKVGSYSPTRLGLYDVHGNVWEWCSDWVDVTYYAKSPLKDPRGPEKGHVRAMRGGCWLTAGANLRAGCRGRSGPEGGSSFIGFRVAASPTK